MLCRIGLNDSQIKEIKPIVLKVIESTKVIFGSSFVIARITNDIQEIGWHFDDFGPNDIYDGMVFTFTISGPGTIVGLFVNTDKKSIF